MLLVVFIAFLCKVFKMNVVIYKMLLRAWKVKYLSCYVICLYCYLSVMLFVYLIKYSSCLIESLAQFNVHLQPVPFPD